MTLARQTAQLMKSLPQMKRSGRRRSKERRNADRMQRLNLRAGAISARLDRIDLAGSQRAGPSGHSRVCHLSLSFWGTVAARIVCVVFSARTGRTDAGRARRAASARRDCVHVPRAPVRASALICDGSSGCSEVILRRKQFIIVICHPGSAHEGGRIVPHTRSSSVPKLPFTLAISGTAS